MFDVGFPELVLVFVIGLLVLGPHRLPKVAAELGKWVGRARRTASQLRHQLEREIELHEVIVPPKTKPAPPSSPSESEGAGNGSPPGVSDSDAANTAAPETRPAAEEPAAASAEAPTDEQPPTDKPAQV